MSGNNRDRKNWTRSLTIVTGIAAATAFIGCMVTVEPEKTDRLYFQNSGGAVLFDHGRHSKAEDSCTACHHELYGAAEAAASCVTCHEDDDMDPTEFEHSELKELHQSKCSDCHTVVGDQEQISSCRTCHPGTQPADTFTKNCSECHDDGEMTPDMMNHDEYLEIEDHECLGCHTPRSISSAYHTNCSSCHLQVAPEKFAVSEGEVRCGSCHLQ